MWDGIATVKATLERVSAWEYGGLSEPSVDALLTASALTFGLSALLLLATAGVHVLARRQQRALQQVRARWKPLFFHAMSGAPQPLPPWSQGDAGVVLHLWLEITELVQGAARERLAALAQELRFEKSALTWLGHRALHRRMLAVSVLGRMRAREALQPLERITHEPDPVLSLMAVRSLLQIDAAGFLPHFLPQIALRPDWPLVRIAAMLAEVPTEVLHPLFRQALQDHHSGSAARLLRLLRTARIDGDAPTLVRFLHLVQPADVLEAALMLTRSPQLAGAVRALRGHPDARVRVQAAAALGRVGTQVDALGLSIMVNDVEGEVRYQAARALAQLPGLPATHLAALHAAVPAGPGHAVLTQARAEHALRAAGTEA